MLYVVRWWNVLWCAEVCCGPLWCAVVCCGVVEWQAREVVEGVELHLLPAMNPDGFTLHTRENANRVDLNRAFPDHWFAEMNAEEAGRQAEVRAVMRWTQRHHFSASASLHGVRGAGSEGKGEG
ncbi:unnamed protein product [Closterium sp. NIES-53]